MGVAWIPYYRGARAATGLCMSHDCNSCPRSAVDETRVSLIEKYDKPDVLSVLNNTGRSNVMERSPV